MYETYGGLRPVQTYASTLTSSIGPYFAACVERDGLVLNGVDIMHSTTIHAPNHIPIQPPPNHYPTTTQPTPPNHHHQNAPAASRYDYDALRKENEKQVARRAYIIFHSFCHLFSIYMVAIWGLYYI